PHEPPHARRTEGRRRTYHPPSARKVGSGCANTQRGRVPTEGSTPAPSRRTDSQKSAGRGSFCFSLDGEVFTAVPDHSACLRAVPRPCCLRPLQQLTRSRDVLIGA